MEEGIPDENLKRQEVSQVRGSYLKASLRGKKEGKKEGRKERRKEGRKEGKKERRKEGKKEGRKERKERGKEREVAQSCLTLAIPWTVAHQAPPSTEFSRQEYWSGTPFP